MFPKKTNKQKTHLVQIATLLDRIFVVGLQLINANNLRMKSNSHLSTYTEQKTKQTVYIAKKMQNATAMRAIRYAKAANVKAIPLGVEDVAIKNNVEK